MAIESLSFVGSPRGSCRNPDFRFNIIIPTRERDSGSPWQRYYAWHPVFPQDEGRIFWLETVWRRRKPNGRWHYRSFRTEAERLAELVSREI